MTESFETRELRGWRKTEEGRIPDDREDRILPWRSVRDIVGLSRTTAWRMQQTGEFPNPVPISANRVGWWESDLTAWKARRRRDPSRPGAYAAPSVPKGSGRFQADKTEAETQVMAVTLPIPESPRAAFPVVTPVRRRGRAPAVAPDQFDFGF